MSLYSSSGYLDIDLRWLVDSCMTWLDCSSYIHDGAFIILCYSSFTSWTTSMGSFYIDIQALLLLRDSVLNGSLTWSLFWRVCGSSEKTLKLLWVCLISLVAFFLHLYLSDLFLPTIAGGCTLDWHQRSRQCVICDIDWDAHRRTCTLLDRTWHPAKPRAGMTIVYAKVLYGSHSLFSMLFNGIPLCTSWWTPIDL